MNKTLHYGKSMMSAFQKGASEFQKQTMISLDGIEFQETENQANILITQEQEEKWLFHLGLCIGKEYQKEEQKALLQACHAAFEQLNGTEVGNQLAEAIKKATT